MAIPDKPITRLEEYLAAILDKIESAGPSVTVEPLTVTANGTTTAPSGKAYSPVTVNVPTPTPSLQSKSVTATQNGTQNITPDSGYDGLSSVAVTTNVPNPNYVETISGTLRFPFGVSTVSEQEEFITDFVAGNTSLQLVFTADFLNIGSREYTVAATSAVMGSGQKRAVFRWFLPQSSSFPAVGLYWYYRSNAINPTGSVVVLDEEEILSNTEQIGIYDNTPTMLTIIHHPMTGSLTPAENQTFGGNV